MAVFARKRAKAPGLGAADLNRAEREKLALRSLSSYTRRRWLDAEWAQQFIADGWEFWESDKNADRRFEVIEDSRGPIAIIFDTAIVELQDPVTGSDPSVTARFRRHRVELRRPICPCGRLWLVHIDGLDWRRVLQVEGVLRAEPFTYSRAGRLGGDITPSLPQTDQAAEHLGPLGLQSDGTVTRAGIGLLPDCRHLRGAGSRVAVLDLGCSPHHPQLAGAEAAWSARFEIPAEVGEIAFQYGPDHVATGREETDWHGTSCAIVAAGRELADGRARGVAPDAEILFISLAPSQLALAEAIIYAALPQWRVRTTNLSPGADVLVSSIWIGNERGGTPYRVPCGVALDHALSMASNLATRSGGVNFVQALGEVPLETTAEIASGDLYAHCDVLTVGGLRSGSIDARLSRHPRGPGVGVVAPFVDIPVLTNADRRWSMKPHRGTSFAAPLVAGGIAALRSAYGLSARCARTLVTELAVKLPGDPVETDGCSYATGGGAFSVSTVVDALTR